LSEEWESRKEPSSLEGSLRGMRSYAAEESDARLSLEQTVEAE
jgi:hypothetical protein